MVIVGCRSKYFKILVKAESPGIVVELPHRFKIGTVLGKFVNAHLEFYRLAPELIFKARITYGAPYHVIDPIS